MYIMEAESACDPGPSRASALRLGKFGSKLLQLFNGWERSAHNLPGFEAKNSAYCTTWRLHTLQLICYSKTKTPPSRLSLMISGYHESLRATNSATFFVHWNMDLKDVPTNICRVVALPVVSNTPPPNIFKSHKVLLINTYWMNTAGTRGAEIAAELMQLIAEEPWWLNRANITKE